MNLPLFQSRKDFTLNALLEACATFDPSDTDQRTIIRVMVVPMLTQQRDFLRLVIRASPESESFRSIEVLIEEALRVACIRIGGGFGDSCGGEENTTVADESMVQGKARRKRKER